ncbi:hypothetical protein DFH11DRAFT_1546398 [Phellopilus nigrolimitatus]|nr:hypothetical protein DFH11DRAFT_1546398 [Phellopilus nigrolimitatus]
MPKRPWATAPQLKHLKDHVMRYEATQEANRTSRWLRTFAETWFLLWPVTGGGALTVAAERTLVTKRLRQWFNNHTGTRGDRSRRDTRTIQSAVRSLILGRSIRKKKQKLQEEQAYSELYWQKKLKWDILPAWETEKKKNALLTSHDYIAYMNRRVKALYAGETDEIKAEVKAHRDKSGSKSSDPEDELLLLDEQSLPEEEKKRRKAARLKQKAMDNVHDILSEVSRCIEEQAGMVMTCQVGGLEPVRGGRVVMYSVNSGQTLGGKLTYEQYDKRYNDHVYLPFKGFVNACFDDRDKKAVSLEFSETSDADDLSATSAHAAPPIHLAPSPTRAPEERGSEGPDSSDSDDTDTDMSDLDDDDFGDAPRDGGDDDDPTDDLCVVDTKMNGDSQILKLRDGRWMTEYELQRLRNIERNSKLMQSLGLVKASEAFKTRAEETLKVRTKPKAKDKQAPRRILPNRAAKRNEEPTSNTDDSPMDVDEDFVVVETMRAETAGLFSFTSTDDDEFDVVLLDPTLVHQSHQSPVASIPNANSVSATRLPVPNLDDTSTRAVSPVRAVSPIRAVSPVRAVSPIRAVSPVRAVSPIRAFSPVRAVSPACVVGAGESAASSLLFPLPPPPPLSSPAKPHNINIEVIPNWMGRPVAHFNEHYRGGEEDVLVGLWKQLEVLMHGTSMSAPRTLLGGKNRPEEISHWSKRHRIMTCVPSLDHRRFKASFGNWLVSLYPAWRHDEGLEGSCLSRALPTGEKWLAIRKGGPNGIFYIVLALFWWFSNACTADEKSDYLAILRDTIWVFQQLEKALTLEATEVSSSDGTGNDWDAVPNGVTVNVGANGTRELCSVDGKAGQHVDSTRIGKENRPPGLRARTRSARSLV